ncbi:MAG: acyl-CoA dehydrogenase family protein, partial [bacterium]|nr:acyl-CoA dehydrogenase family protein [bacterium]
MQATAHAGLSFDLTPEQEAIQRLCRELADDVIAPAAEELDAKAEFPYAIVEQMAELGLLGIPWPEAYGGIGADTVSYALAVMEISRGDASVGITMAAHTSLGSAPFYYFGSEE